MQKKPEVALVIPFFNKKRTFPEIIHKTHQYFDIIIAVNDGSTYDFLMPIKIYERIVLISNKKNEGKEFSINRVMKKRIELNSDTTITFDDDLRISPEYIPSLTVVLNRFEVAMGKCPGILKLMPLRIIRSNILASFILLIKLKQLSNDSQ